MKIFLTDTQSIVLELTTEIEGKDFDAITCSPRTDDGFGFSLLRFYAGLELTPALDSACKAAVARNEVCILPEELSPKWRVLLTPTLKTRDESSRAEAHRLMIDLFNASQAGGVGAQRLLITHFYWVQKYPRQHVIGILDGIRDLRVSGFRGLKTIGVDIRNLSEHFERDSKEYFSASI